MVLDKTIAWKLALANSDNTLTLVFGVICFIILACVIWFTESYLEKHLEDNYYGV
jgi:hypothetical protein